MKKLVAILTKAITLANCFLFCFILKGNAQTHIVEIETNFGNMRFKLYNDTPKHRDEFIKLAGEGYYENTLFYRVIQNFLIQGGSKSSRNASPGARIGYGDPDYAVDDEIRANHFHQKGALCAPRQPDKINPFKQSDISQFYIVKGKVYSQEALDTLEMAVNRPIRSKIISEVFNPSVKGKLRKLKKEHKVAEFRELAKQVKQDISSKMSLQPGILKFTEKQRKAYTTKGGYPALDGQYTVFGQCISGFSVIDKIAALKTDKNHRPYIDIKIHVKVIQ